MFSRSDISLIVLIETAPEITCHTGIKVLVLCAVEDIDIVHDIVRVVTGHKWLSSLFCSRELPVCTPLEASYHLKNYNSRIGLHICTIWRFGKIRRQASNGAGRKGHFSTEVKNSEQ